MNRALQHTLRDERGASIVIALVFFLICAIVGSVVVTAASVNAKAVQTHKDLQQDEYSMASAADLIAQQLGGEDKTRSAPCVTVSISYGPDEKPSVDVSKVYSEVGKGFWTKDRTATILACREQGIPYTIGDSSSDRLVVHPPFESKAMDPVYGKVTVDADLNVTVELSLDEELSASSPYNMTVSVQCTPTYDAAGRLTAFSYGKNTVVKKASGGQS